MKDWGYTEAQEKKMAEVMYIMREWFEDSIIIVKDRRKAIYWEQDCDIDLVYPFLKNAYDGLCEPDLDIIDDEEAEWEQGGEWGEEE